MGKTPSELDLHALGPLEWVKEELKRQESKWGQQNKNPFVYACTLGEEYGEACKALNEIIEGKVDTHEGMLELEYELIQTAAVAVAMVGAIRRRLGTHSTVTPIMVHPPIGGHDA